MADSISSLSDTELLAKAESLVTTVTGFPVQYGLTVQFVEELTSRKDAFSTALNAHVQAQAQARSKRVSKDTERATLEQKIRDARAHAKAAKIAEAKYAEMGIPTGSTPAPTNATVPVVTVNTSERLRHTISWSDNAANGNKKKPRGVMGAEIWVKLDGPPPGSEKDCTFVALDSATPYVTEYQPEWGGKTAHYLVRWRMRDGSALAWGETVSATITA